MSDEHRMPRDESQLPVTRAEFRPIAQSVRRIETALIGENPMDPDPNALVGKVIAHGARISSAEASIREARWGYRAAVFGVIGVVIHKIFWGDGVGGGH